MRYLCDPIKTASEQLSTFFLDIYHWKKRQDIFMQLHKVVMNYRRQKRLFSLHQTHGRHVAESFALKRIAKRHWNKQKKLSYIPLQQNFSFNFKTVLSCSLLREEKNQGPLTAQVRTKLQIRKHIINLNYKYGNTVRLYYSSANRVHCY